MWWFSDLTEPAAQPPEPFHLAGCRGPAGADAHTNDGPIMLLTERIRLTREGAVVCRMLTSEAGQRSFSPSPHSIVRASPAAQRTVACARVGYSLVCLMQS